MPPTDGDGELEPLVQPHLIRLLRKRPRLFNDDFRQEILYHLEENIKERRKPDTVAERSVSRLMGEAQQVTQPAVKNRVRDKLENENRKRLNRI